MSTLRTSREPLPPDSNSTATGYRQRPETAHDSRTIGANLGYVGPEKRKVGPRRDRAAGPLTALPLVLATGVITDMALTLAGGFGGGFHDRFRTCAGGDRCGCARSASFPDPGGPS